MGNCSPAEEERVAVGYVPDEGNNPSLARGSTITHRREINQLEIAACQGKVAISPPWQSRNVAFSLDALGVRVNLRVPVKRERPELR